MAKEKKQYVDKEILFGLVKEFHSINFYDTRRLVR